jgi:hypothetical protein
VKSVIHFYSYSKFSGILVIHLVQVKSAPIDALLCATLTCILSLSSTEMSCEMHFHQRQADISAASVKIDLKSLPQLERPNEIMNAAGTATTSEYIANSGRRERLLLYHLNVIEGVTDRLNCLASCIALRTVQGLNGTRYESAQMILAPVVICSSRCRRPRLPDYLIQRAHFKKFSIILDIRILSQGIKTSFR